MTAYNWADVYAYDYRVVSNPPQEDIILEGLFTADASGVLDGDWAQTGGANTIRVAAHFYDGAESPSLRIEEGIKTSGGSPVVVRTHALTIEQGGNDRAYAEIDVTGRAVRFMASSMGNAKNLAIVIKKVN